MPLEESVIHSEYRNEDEILFMAQSSHPDNSTLVAIFVITVVTLLMIALITWKLCSLCNKWYKRRDELSELEEDRHLEAALTQNEKNVLEAKKFLNSYRTVTEIGTASSPTIQRPPCLNCNLIAMGEAVSYADGSCPQCGNNT